LSPINQYTKNRKLTKNKIGKMSPKKDIGQKIVGFIYGEI
jgi:hypothetical protein